MPPARAHLHRRVGTAQLEQLELSQLHVLLELPNMFRPPWPDAWEEAGRAVAVDLGAADVWTTPGGHKVHQMAVQGESAMRPTQLKLEELKHGNMS